MTAIKKSEVAESIPFDNDTNGFIADEVQGAIEELNEKVGVSASPGYSWGRSGNASSGTWLNNDEVPSNNTGRTIALINPSIQNISVANENINTFDISVYEHEGNSINLTLLVTVNVIASRSAFFQIDIPATSGRQLAVRVTSGSGKNIVVGVQLSGTVI